MTLFFNPCSYGTIPRPGEAAGTKAHLPRFADMDLSANRLYQMQFENLQTNTTGDPLYDYWHTFIGNSTGDTQYNTLRIVTWDLNTRSVLYNVTPDLSFVFTEALDSELTNAWNLSANPVDSVSRWCPHFFAGSWTNWKEWIDKPFCIPGTDWIVGTINFVGYTTGLGKLTYAPAIFMQKLVSINVSTGTVNTLAVPFNIITPNIDATKDRLDNGGFRIERVGKNASETSSIIGTYRGSQASGDFLKTFSINHTSGVLTSRDIHPSSVTFPMDSSTTDYLNSYHIFCSTTGSVGNTGATFFTAATDPSLSSGDRQKNKRIDKVSISSGNVLTVTELTTISKLANFDVIFMKYLEDTDELIIHYRDSSASYFVKIDATTGADVVSETSPLSGGNYISLAPSNKKATDYASEATYHGLTNITADDTYIYGFGGIPSLATTVNKFYRVATSDFTVSEWGVFAAEEIALDAFSYGVGEVGVIDATRNGIWYPFNYDPDSEDTGANTEWVLITTEAVAPPQSPAFYEERDTSYYDWADVYGEATKDFDSYLLTGAKVRGEGHRSGNMNYITFFGNVEEASSAYARGRWDWSNSSSSGKWSTEQQIFTANRDYRDVSRKRLLMRGSGPALQLYIRSESGKPFDIIGWSTWEAVNATP